MRFDLHAIRFDFEGRERIFFPPGQAANILRGALGTRLHHEIFAPSCARGPSGLIDRPRPFVIRARHLDGRIVPGGEAFHFDLNVFSRDSEALIASFAEVFRDGLGQGRGTAELVAVNSTPRSIDLTPRPGAPSRIRVDFLSPTELKHEGGIASRPDFPILFARIRDRISTLRALYGPGPLPVEFEALAARAAAVRMIACDLRPIANQRRSSRTGQVHPLGGFVGPAEYEGDLAEFIPWLEAAQWTGIGRQTVWGKGEIAVTALCE